MNTGIRWAPLVMLVALGILWGSNPAFSKVLGEAGIGPFGVVFWQTFSAGVILLPVCRLRRQKIASIIERNETEAATLLSKTIRDAKSRLEESAGRELERLLYLRSVNASVRPEEIELVRSQRDMDLQSLDKAKPRLDAVRLIVTV